MGVIEKSGLNLANKINNFPPHPPYAKKRNNTTRHTNEVFEESITTVASCHVSLGLVLVGSINGGQASNLCTLIAGGDVALSVPWAGEFRCCCGCGCCSRTWEPEKAESMICILPYRVGYPHPLNVLFFGGGTLNVSYIFVGDLGGPQNVTWTLGTSSKWMVSLGEGGGGEKWNERPGRW